MLQNLLGLTSSALSGAAGVSTEREGSLGPDLESNSEIFSKVLIGKEINSGKGLGFVVPVEASGAPPVLPPEIAAALRDSIEQLLVQIESGGVDLPERGSALPLQSLDQQSLQQFAQKLDTLLLGGPQALESAELLPQLRGWLAQLSGQPLPDPLANGRAAGSAIDPGSSTFANLDEAALSDQLTSKPGVLEGLAADSDLPAPTAVLMKTLLGEALAGLRLVLTGEALPEPATRVNSLLAQAATPQPALAVSTGGGEQPLSAVSVSLAAGSAVAPTIAGAAPVAEGIAAVVRGAASPERAPSGPMQSAGPRAVLAGAVISGDQGPGLAPQNAAAPISMAGNVAAVLPHLIVQQSALPDARFGTALRNALEQMAAQPQPSPITGAATTAQPAALATPMASVFSTSLALPVSHSEWGQQLSQRIGWLTGQGINRAEILLNPPELGPMQVRIESSEQSARVVISVHSPVTRDALEAQLPRLRDLFANQGLDLLDVDVESGDQSGQQAAGFGGDRDTESEDAEAGRLAAAENGQRDNALATAGVGESDRSDADMVVEAAHRLVLHYGVDAYA